MDTSAFTKIIRLPRIKKLCILLVTSCVLLLGSAAVITPEPARATGVINTLPCAPEGQVFSYVMTCASTGAGFTCKVVNYDHCTPNTLLNVSWNSTNGRFYCTPPPGSCGTTYTLYFWCQEYDNNNNPYYPPQLHDVALPICACAPTPTVTTFNYTVGIGSGLTSSTAPVAVNGTNVANLAGGENRNLEGRKGNNYTVSVPNTIEGNSGSRFVIQGTAVKTVNYENPNASFDYAAEYYVEFKTDPINVAQLPGSNWYPKGTQVTSTAPELVKSEGENKEYAFVQWNLAGGGTSLSKDLALTVNNAGSYIAVYNSHPIAVVETKTDYTLMWIIILVVLLVVAGIAIAILARRGSQSAKKT